MKQGDADKALLEIGRLAETIRRLSLSDETASARVTELQTTPADCRRIAKALYRARRKRDAIFGIDIFGEPTWDLLLDLYANQGDACSISSACIASAAPGTTALRHIANLIEEGLIDRTPDPEDRRRRFVQLTERGVRLMDEAMVKLASHLC